MKTKKARKRLSEADELLAAVIDGYKADDTGVQDLLNTARKLVASAITSLEKPAVKKPPVAAAVPGQRRSSAGRKRLSKAAKKRLPAAKSKGVEAITNRPLHQTA